MLSYWVFRRPQLLNRTVIGGARALFITWLLISPRITGADLARVLSMHVAMGGTSALLALALAISRTRVLVKNSR